MLDCQRKISKFDLKCYYVTLLIEQVLDEEETERVQQIENQFKLAKDFIQDLLSRHESAKQEWIHSSILMSVVNVQLEK